MTYDNFNQKILIYEPLKNELKSVDFELINKNLSYKNPFCLNYDEKLFIIGGFIIDTQIKNQLNQIIQPQTLRINFNYFDDFQKSNSYFVPTNICFYYDPIKGELKALPVLVYNRANHSCIIFQKKFLWVIGGNTKLCEVLNIKNISNAKFDKTSFHPGYELIQITTNPLLLNYSDEFILSLDSKYESQSNLNNSFINIQVFSYITNKWNVEKIQCILDNINCFYNFLGCYHNKDEPQDLIIFADVKSDNTQSNFNFHFKESKIIKFDLNYLSSQFQLSLKSCYKNEVELFQIYNSIYIYEFDDDAYSYSFDNFQNKVTLAKTHLRCNIK